MRRTSSVTLMAVVALSGLVVSATAAGGWKASASQAVVKVAFNKKLKKRIVVDGSGRTLYMFTEDTNGTSTCTAQLEPQCTKLWPALVSDGAARAGTGIDASKLGLTTRPNGKTQVTYNRHPLYHFHGGLGFVGDRRPGDVRGQGVGAVWYVLSPRGRPIRT